MACTLFEMTVWDFKSIYRIYIYICIAIRYYRFSFYFVNKSLSLQTTHECSVRTMRANTTRDVMKLNQIAYHTPMIFNSRLQRWKPNVTPGEQRQYTIISNIATLTFYARYTTMVGRREYRRMGRTKEQYLCVCVCMCIYNIYTCIIVL